MPALRELLGAAGFDDVRTYVQSGNVVLRSKLPADEAARQCERAIARDLGLELDVVVRTRDELAEVVQRDPLGDVARDHKRYLVTFLSERPDPELVSKLERFRADPEAFVQVGREFYSWHPAGVARSKLWARLAGKDLGVTATARNWTTVTTLLSMADE